MINWIYVPAHSSYLVTIEEMELAVNEIIKRKQPTTIFLVEYHDLYTAGTSASIEEKVAHIYDNIPVYQTGRGGKYTYHGPGQRVIYPILNLQLYNVTDIKHYVQQLQLTVVKTLQYFGINSFISQQDIGVWVSTPTGDKKIASVGIRVRKWVTYHGIAVNINTDLTKYDGIKPCGLSGDQMISCQSLGINISLTEFDTIYKKYFEETFIIVTRPNDK